MIDVQRDGALTRRFLTLVGLAPFLMPLIQAAEDKGGKGQEKQAQVLAGMEQVLTGLAGAGYVPHDYWNDETKREVGKLTNALVTSYNNSGAFKHRKEGAAGEEEYRAPETFRQPVPWWTRKPDETQEDYDARMRNREQQQ